MAFCIPPETRCALTLGWDDCQASPQACIFLRFISATHGPDATGENQQMMFFHATRCETMKFEAGPLLSPG